MRQYASSTQRFYGMEETVPLAGVVPREGRPRVVEQDAKGQPRVNRINYEMAVLQTLRERVRCKELWIPGAQRYRNPEEDLPADFEAQQTRYYQALAQPLDPELFITGLQHQMHQALQLLDAGMPGNPGVTILQRP